MRPRLVTGGLKKTRPWEYLVRFVFGGLVTALAGLVAHAWGPTVGGLFLAFPAILPASLLFVAILAWLAIDGLLWALRYGMTR